MKKIFTFEERTMNGTVTASSSVFCAATRELAEKARQAAVDYNKRHQDPVGLCYWADEIRETTVYESADEVPILQKPNIRFRAVTPLGGDCTQGYEADGVEGMTVREFIQYICEENTNECGTFRVYDKQKSVLWKCDFQRGVLDRKTMLAEDTGRILGRVITRVTAGGGWGLMDYDLYT